MSFRFYTTAILTLTAFGLFGVSFFYTPEVAQAQASWTCSVDGNTEKLRTFELGSPSETATMGVYTNADNPDNLYSTIYTRNAMTSELTTVNISGSSPGTGTYSNATIEDLGWFNGGEADAIDFSSPSSQSGGDLYDDMSIAPENRGDVARVYYPSPPSSPSDGDTWDFNFDFYGQMSSQSPDGTPPQNVEWNITVSCSASGGGGSSPPPPEDSCRTVSVSGASLDSDAFAYEGSSDTDDNYSSVNFSSHTNSGEYVSQVSFDSSVSYDYVAADTNCTANALSSGSVNSGGGSESLYITGDGYPSGDSKSAGYSISLDPDGGYTTANFAAETGASCQPGGIHGIGSHANVSNVELEICDIPTNNAPTATDDGTPSDRICTTEPGSGTVTIGVLGNDSDPDGDSLSIGSFPSYPSRGAVSVVTEDGEDVVAYTPSSSGDDSFSYQISDGNGGADTATVYVNNPSSGSGDGCGQVVADISAGIEGSDENLMTSTTISPRYGGAHLTPLSADQAASTGWNVELSTNSKIIEIRREDVDLPEGYTLPQSRWIQKDVEHERTGQQNAAELGISHNLAAPTASFTYSPSSSIQPGDSITFDASYSSEGDGSITSYAWNFGDGSTASGVTPTHSYSSDGTYTVDLTVTDDNGKTDTSSQSISVVQPNRAPTAGFNWSIMNDPCSGIYAEVAFDSSSFSSDPDGDSLSYSWTFGDGGTASRANPIHYYPAGSTDSDGWLVRLTVSDGEYSDTHQDGVVISCGGGGGGGGTEPIELR